MDFIIGNYIVDKFRTDFIKKIFSENQFEGRLLDVGCGIKPYKKIYGNHMSEMIGIDVEQSPHKNNQIDIYYDGKTIPFDDNYFDFIICTEVLGHAEEPEKLISEMQRVLKKGGHLLLTVPLLQLLNEVPYDFHRYTPFGLRNLMKSNNLEIKTIAGYSGLVGFFISSAIRYPLRAMNKTAKLLRFKLFYSAYNPIIFLLILMPQILYTLTSKIAYNEKVYTNKTYRSYGVLACKL